MLCMCYVCVNIVCVHVLLCVLYVCCACVVCVCVLCVCVCVCCVLRTHPSNIHSIPAQVVKAGGVAYGLVQLMYIHMYVNRIIRAVHSHTCMPAHLTNNTQTQQIYECT